MEWVMLAQVVVAAGLGAAIGLERELGAQSAGLRTHMLVSLGAALFTLAGVGIGRRGRTRRARLSEDVEIAAQVDVSTVVPVLRGGVFTAA